RRFATETQRHGAQKDEDVGRGARSLLYSPSQIIDRLSVLKSFSLCLSVSVVALALVAPACRRRERPLYAVIPKGQANAFWQTVHAGAAAEAKEAGVDIDWNGPALESDFTRQITIVDDFINRHVDGIVLAPNDREALAPAIHRVHEAGIPLTIIDSGANTDEYVSI